MQNKVDVTFMLCCWERLRELEAGCLALGGADAVFLGTAPRQAPPHLAPPHIFVEQAPGTPAPLFDDTEDTPAKGNVNEKTDRIGVHESNH